MTSTFLKIVHFLINLESNKLATFTFFQNSHSSIQIQNQIHNQTHKTFNNKDFNIHISRQIISNSTR